MSDVVNLDDRRARKQLDQTLRRAVQRLEKIRTELHDLAVSIALEGCWKKWSDEAPVGSFASFDDENLTATGDERVVALVQLRATVERTAETLRKDVL